MGRFNGVLVASDYDGTLVPSDKQVTEKVQSAIRYFISEGGRFTVCTGRAFQGFHAYRPDIINAPVLLSNGGMAYDYSSRKIVFTDGIGSEGVDALRNIRDLFPTLSIELFGFPDTYVIHPHDQAMRHFTSQNIRYQVIGDPAEAAMPWSKVMLGGSPGTVAEVQQYIRSSHPSVSFIPTDGGYLEVMKPGVHKGSALLKLAAMLDIGKEKIHAVGDGYNDVDMLRAASSAFVPVNGDELAKQASTYIVSSNEDAAIADVIQILNKQYC